MTSFKQEQILAARSSGLKFAAVSAVAIATALCTTPVVFAQAHTPLASVDVPTVPAADLLGDPMGSEIAAEVEAQIMRGKIRRALGRDVSPGAKEAARMAYAQGVFAPLWSPETAEALLQIIPLAEENGFEPTMTESAIRDIIENRFEGAASQRASADLRLTALWLVMASKMSGGLSDEGEMVRSTESRPTRSELVAALRRAAQNDPIIELENYASQTPQYGELKNSLQKYRQYAENGGWMKIRDGDDMLEPGMDDPRVPALRRRLAAEGYVNTIPFGWIYASVELNLEDAPTVYNDLLVEQVKAFQSAHGLEQDGILGPSTLAALNESVESKIDRIESAMTYWRENSDLGDRYIWVNIPSYRAEAWSGDHRDISMKTIVGKKRTPSAAFSDEIEYIVVNPK